MSSKVSGISAARTSRPPYLSLAPAPGLGALAAVDVTPNMPADLPDDPAAAYRQGRLDTLGAALDERIRAVANLDRFEAMGFEEIGKLIEVLGWFADAKRPTLRLVGDTDDIGPIVEAALSEIRTTEADILPWPTGRRTVRFTVIEGDCGHYRVAVGGVSADETHYTSLAAAQAVADRLNTPAATA